MKKLVFSLLTLFVALVGYGQITSNGTGNWSDGSTWVGGIAPTAADNVIIATGHTVTLTANAACNNLILQTTTGTNLAIDAFTLEVNGTLNGPNTTYTNSIITSGTGRLKFVGTSRALFGFNWNIVTGLDWRFEVALNTGQIGTTSLGTGTNAVINAKEIIITSGTFDVSSSGTNLGHIRIDGNAANTGSLTIEDGATLICRRIYRTSSGSDPFASLTMNGNSKIQFFSNASSSSGYLVNVSGGFPVYTYSSNAIIEFIGSSSGNPNTIPYPNLSITLANSSSSRTLTGTGTTIAGNLTITTATASLGSGTLAINGNLVVNNDAIITSGSNSAIYNFAGATNSVTINNGGVLETVNRALVSQAAGSTTPLNTQYSGIETLTLNAGSTISYAIPGGATHVHRMFKLHILVLVQ
jgi:hypothetical protein